jgi:hypothetical protein
MWGSMRTPLVLIAGAMVLHATPGALAGAGSQRLGPPSVRELLRTVAQATDAEWTAVNRGEPMAKVLSTDAREIAVAGAVRIAAPSERLIARYREIENLKRTAVVLDLGRFSQPPAPSDLASAPMEDYNLDLRDCRPGECRVRLSEADIQRFHREVDWRAADWRERSRAVWTDVLAGYAAAFARHGRKALPTYANKREPLSVPAELSLLVDRFGFVGDIAPPLLPYLREFGPRAPDGSDELMYWSKEDFGIRPVMRLSHQTIYRTAGAHTILVATSQIYADHYLDAGLTLTMAIDAPDPGGSPAFYMVSVSRARTRSLSGFMRSFVRSTVQGRSRDALQKILGATKAALEKKV